MSKQAVEAVIGKAVMDSEFREALFANPDKALHGFDLTEDEIAALKKIDAETMESMAGSLDERISKSFIVGIGAEGFGGRGKPKGRVKRPPRRFGGPKKD